MSQFETDAIHLFIKSLGTGAMHKKLAEGLVKSSKNWAIKHLKHWDVPYEVKSIEKGKDKTGKDTPWLEFVKTHPRAVYMENGKFVRVKTKTLEKQLKLIELKKKRVMPEGKRELVPPTDMKKRNLLNLFRTNRLHEYVMDDIKRIKSEIKYNQMKISQYERFFKPTKHFKPNIYINRPPEFEETVKFEVPLKKRIVYRLVAKHKETVIEKLKGIMKKLEKTRSMAHERVVEITKNNYMRSQELWKSIKNRELLEKVYKKKEHKKEEFELVNALSEHNLGDIMVVAPKPFKTQLAIPNDKRANWKNPYFLKLFRSRARSLLYAIRHNDKTHFLDKLVTKEIKLGELHDKEYWDIMVQREVKEEPVTRVEDRPDGMFKCVKCKSWKTSYVEKQTRSADEPMTIFVTCHFCGNVMKR